MLSAPASSAVTQQLLGAGHLGGGDPPQAQGAVGGCEEGKLKVLQEENPDWRGGGLLWVPVDQGGLAAEPQEGLQHHAVP